RRHSTLRYISPAEYEEQRKSAWDGVRNTGNSPGSEVLLVPNVGHGTFTVLGITHRERVLAAGDDIVGADGELAAPGSTPGQPEAEAGERGRVARGVDHVADDAGAQRANAAADAQRLGVPLAGERRRLRRRHQACLGHRPGDRDEAFVAELLLREHGEVVDVNLA